VQQVALIESHRSAAILLHAAIQFGVFASLASVQSNAGPIIHTIAASARVAKDQLTFLNPRFLDTPKKTLRLFLLSKNVVCAFKMFGTRG
jgi:hypothetical protein